MQNLDTNKLFVAWQDDETREWIPVALLSYSDNHYHLTYIEGIKRCKNFSGFGRMTNLKEHYISDSLFPFFANRLISKSRPEYKDYIRWVGLSDTTDDPMKIMAITGGLRATDPFEIIPFPCASNPEQKFSFFARGVRYFPSETHTRINTLAPQDKLYLLRDFQNTHDHQSILLRTEDPKTLIGHIPRYYCSALNRIIDKGNGEIRVMVERINLDAPFDMRLLCSAKILNSEEGELLDNESDFQPLS